MTPAPLARLLAALCFASLAVPPAGADGFFGLFGDKEEQALPAPDEMARREGEARALFAEARAAAEAGDSGKAAKRFRKVAKEFPLTTVAPEAAFSVGHYWEQEGKMEKAFEAYQVFIDEFKADSRFQAALDRQYAIANACKEALKEGGVIGLRFGTSRTETIEMFTSIVGNAPRSRMAARSRLAIAELHEESDRPDLALKTYQTVVDEHPGTAEAQEAQFQIGQTYVERAEESSKDRSTVASAREAFEDYLIRHPEGERSGEVRGRLDTLGEKEAEQTFAIARFYEKTGKQQAAAIYYREVLRLGNPAFTEKARAKLDELGAAGITPPAPEDEGWLLPESTLTKERDDYVGPVLPGMEPRRLPALRYSEPEELPGELPSLPPSASPLLGDLPLPPDDLPAGEDGSAGEDAGATDEKQPEAGDGAPAEDGGAADPAGEEEESAGESGPGDEQP